MSGPLVREFEIVNQRGLHARASAKFVQLVSGFQADVGQDYWGALYDESRRNKVLAGPAKEDIPKIAKFDDWNEYVIRCEGPRIRLWLNGQLTVDYLEKEEKIERTGIIGLQIHGGAKARVLYKDIQIEELPPAK